MSPFSPRGLCRRCIARGLLAPSENAKPVQSGLRVRCPQCGRLIDLGHAPGLTYAWLLYADDNRERFAYASPLNLGTYDPYAWVSGLMDFDANNPSNWDPTADLRRSPLWKYCGESAGLFRCPADRSTLKPSSGPYRGQTVPRVRSMSMCIPSPNNRDVIWLQEHATRKLD